MPRFAANLTMMYQEFSFLDRFASAAEDGFTAVEFLFPYDYPAADIAERLKGNGLQQVLFNTPPGDWKSGERGCAALPGREAEFQEGLVRALEYAHILSCPRLHPMAGLVPAGSDRATLRAVYVANLAWAAEKAASAQVELVIEPIASRNMHGFFLNLQEEAHAIVEEIGRSNLKVLMDLYHCQVEEGDLAVRMKKYLAGPRLTKVGHFQIAGVPERHEPDTGEVRYEFLFERMDQLGYEGWVGCEYIPAAGTSEGLGWLKKWLPGGS